MKNIGKRLTLVFVIMAINISCHKEEQKNQFVMRLRNR